MLERRSSFEEIRAAGEELRSLLTTHGIVLRPTSVLAEAFTNVELAMRYWKAQLLPTDHVSERLVSDLAAVQTLSAVVPTIKGSGAVPGLTERLQALGGGDPRLTSRGEQSGDRDAVFELLCWHICMQFAQDVAFAGPDVECTFQGQRFGIACKAHYGAPRRGVKAIRKGWGQIISSKVEHGFVMVHVTNHFPHERLSARGAEGQLFTPVDEASLNNLFEDNLTATTKPLERGLLASLNEYPKQTKGRFHGVVYAAHTLAPFRGTTYRVGGAVYQRIGPPLSDQVAAFRDKVNDYWQNLEGSGAASG
jgi:hypothetical protein